MNEPRRIARHHWLGEILSVRGPSSSSARLVACALFNHMQREGTGATVAGRTLAIETGLAHSTVQIALRELIEQGWILRFEKGRGQFGKPIYMQEATLPNVPSTGSSNAKGNGLTTGTLHRHANVPSDENQCTDLSKPMYRLAGLNVPTTGTEPLNQSETIKKPVMYRPKVGTDPGSDDLTAETESRIRKAIEAFPEATDAAIARLYVQGVTVADVRRVRGSP